jgi:hypothetical protein
MHLPHIDAARTAMTTARSQPDLANYDCSIFGQARPSGPFVRRAVGRTAALVPEGHTNQSDEVLTSSRRSSGAKTSAAARSDREG